MTDTLKSILNLQRPLNQENADWLIDKLGETPSIATLEAVVAAYKKSLKDLLSKDLLEWMHENDQLNFETEDVKVNIKTYVSSKIADNGLAYDWLESEGYGDLIKDTLDFPKGELEKSVIQELEEKGLSFKHTHAIHHSSLKKIMSDRLKDGEILPDELDGFQINYYDECVVKEK